MASVAKFVGSVADQMLEATNKTKWDEDQQLMVLCARLTNLVPGTDFEKLSEATKNWAIDSSLPKKTVLVTLCLLTDELEAAPDFKGIEFDEYLAPLVTAAVEALKAAEKPSEEPKAEEAPKRKRGRPKKIALTECGQPAVKSVPVETREQTAEEQLRGGCIHTDTVKSKTNVVDVGQLDGYWCRSTKQWLELEGPIPDAKIGSLMCSQKFDLPDGMTLCLEAINAKPKLGIDVYIRKAGKSVCSLQPIRAYQDTFEITHGDTTYRVLPPE